MKHLYATTAFLLSAISLHAGTYDAAPLRGALSTKPHFQTNLERSTHRFADAKINKYRLYDFYQRQAKHHLSLGDASEPLLPFPGLEGGRRGHWGGTNEKTSSAVLDRSKEPAHPRLVDRGHAGNQHISIPHKGKKDSVCLFANSGSAMSKVLLNATLITPEHPFSYKVDRLGFDLRARGQHYLSGHKNEWHLKADEPAEVTRLGYHLAGSQVVYRRQIGKARMLDMPNVSYSADTAIYQRHIEWLDNAPSLRFPLPGSALKNTQVKLQKKSGGWLATVSNGQQKLTHSITSSAGVKGISLKESDGVIWVQFPPSRKGTTLQMSSWLSSAKASMPKHAALRKISQPSKLLRNTTRFFKKDVQVTGKLNADPAASGTAYEIDDIPVPAENPFGTPMTLSGLTFSDDGNAYVCTLVGDVWKVTGIDKTLKKVTWQRFASGLNSPSGLEMVDGLLHVLTQNGIVQLYDTNKDGEADIVRRFTQMRFPSKRVHGLQRDAEGNFYFVHVSGIHRVSADGKTLKKISHPARNPFGLGVREDGLALSDASEGNNSNGTCTIYESAHPENSKTVGKNRRILYLPRGIDNSPAGRLFLNSKKFGPLGNGLLGLSYGTGRVYQILREPNNGSPQAALQLLPGEFSSGASRMRIHPRDGQLYVVGLDGWGDFGVTEGCFHRLRYTGKQQPLPVSWKAYSNGISVRFSQPLDPSSLSQLFLQQWNYVDSAHTYGSAEYSVREPEQIGHDRVKIESSYLSADHKELFIHAPSILPAMCTQIYGQLKSKSGNPVTLDLYATINQLSKDQLKGSAAPSSKPRTLEVPFKQNNGDTYTTLTGFFDKLAGKAIAARATGPVVTYTPQQLNYSWIKKNILQAHACSGCHQAGMKNDFSTYPKLLQSIDLKNPEKSHLFGMVQSGSMPPSPMPAVAPEMQKALLEWIKMGAPK